MHNPNLMSLEVAVIDLKQKIPEGWRVMTYEEGQAMKYELYPLLDQWSIVAFDRGRLDGKGYGYRFMEQYGDECGELFIIKCTESELKAQQQLSLAQK